LKSTALVPLAFPSPPHPLPTYRAFISLYKDNINKRESSVGHIKATVGEWDTSTKGLGILVDKGVGRFPEDVCTHPCTPQLILHFIYVLISQRIQSHVKNILEIRTSA
jgi:hypothetical protein